MFYPKRSWPLRVAGMLNDLNKSSEQTSERLEHLENSEHISETLAWKYGLSQFRILPESFCFLGYLLAAGRVAEKRVGVGANHITDHKALHPSLVARGRPGGVRLVVEVHRLRSTVPVTKSSGILTPRSFCTHGRARRVWDFMIVFVVFITTFRVSFTDPQNEEGTGRRKTKYVRP